MLIELFAKELLDTGQPDRRQRDNKATPGNTSSLNCSQRMLNAIEPGSEVPIYRHRATSETVVLLRGRAVQYIYDNACEVVERGLMGDGACAMNVPMGQWHRLEALESGTVIMEFKDGAYEPIQECDVLR